MSITDNGHNRQRS